MVESRSPEFDAHTPFLPHFVGPIFKTSDASRAWGAVYVRRQKAGGALDEELF